MNAVISVTLALVVALAGTAQAQDEVRGYSQETLLKNWALSRCLGQVYEEAGARQDANASASAYLEFGHQPIEAYEALSVVVAEYANRDYAGSVEARFGTMKCVDLLHSKKLDELARELAKPR